MSIFGARFHADNRSGNPYFDLCAHKLAQALTIADYITGRGKQPSYFRMTTTTAPQKCRDDAWVMEQQRTYLRDFLEEADLWWDSLEDCGGLHLDPSLRKDYMRRIQAALEVKDAGLAGTVERDESAGRAGSALEDGQGRAAPAGLRAPGLRSKAARAGG